jgi:seryl-tRNA synthetase
MKGWKIIILILFLLSIALLGFAIFVFMEKQAEEARRIQVEGELSTQLSENKKLSLAYDQLTQSKQELERVLVEEKRRAKEILKTLENEKKNHTRTSGDLKMTSEHLNKVKLEYQQLSQELEVLRQKLTDIGAGSPVALSKKAPKLTTEIEIPPVVVQASPSEPAQVLVVNRDFNFIVIDRGSQQGIARGEFMFIARDGKPVARVQVEKVYDYFSAAAIVEESKSNRLREGDSVTKS